MNKILASFAIQNTTLKDNIRYITYCIISQNYIDKI